MEEFLRNNWFWIALLGLFFFMHRRGGCGSHGGRHRGTHKGEERR